ncbi:MAG: rhomboid family intramembrane serine protease [Pseudomonadota bacterium]
MNRDTPPIIFWLLMVNTIIFLLPQALPSVRFPLGALALYSNVENFRLWQIITYAFLHGDFSHLLFNMFALWMFGRDIEQTWGSARFATYYFACVITAAITQLIWTGFPSGFASTVGASGGVFGILMAYGMCFPNRRIMLLVPPIPMKAKYFVVIFAILELYLGFANTNSGTAHFAHLGGLVGGLILIQYWRRKRLIR